MEVATRAVPTGIRTASIIPDSIHADEDLEVVVGKIHEEVEVVEVTETKVENVDRVRVRII